MVPITLPKTLRPFIRSAYWEDCNSAFCTRIFCDKAPGCRSRQLML